MTGNTVSGRPGSVSGERRRRHESAHTLPLGRRETPDGTLTPSGARSGPPSSSSLTRLDRLSFGRGTVRADVGPRDTLLNRDHVSRDPTPFDSRTTLVLPPRSGSP